MWDKVGTRNRRSPLLLRPDNFTPPNRTPWGGRRIVEELKAGRGLDTRGPVGEAWELSVEPDFPSRLADGPLLDEVLRADPHLLGREAPLGSTALLVKLIDAAENLSLQVHPIDADPKLGPDESGKSEAWYIVDAEPGAGLYLGFGEGISEAEVREAITNDGHLDALMHFVPVSVGDLFLIAPGTPHAIGKGVLLLEPQRVVPGKRGVTYRFWDWNRKYDSSGRLDPSGRPRALHVVRALEVTDWHAPRGRRLIDRIRYPAGSVETRQSANLETLASPTGPLRSESFLLRRLAGSGRVELPAENCLRALTVFEGRLTLGDDDVSVPVGRGQTAALPASVAPLRVDLDRAHALVCGLA